MPKIKINKTGAEADVSVVTAGHMVAGGYATLVEQSAPKQWTDGREVDEVEAAEPGWVDYTKTELVSYAEGRGLDASGTKADLVARLESDDAGRA